MNRKILYTLIAFLLCAFTFSFCFATDEHPIQDAANTVKNVVGGAENAVENGAKDIGNATKNATNSAQNTMNHAGDTMKGTTTGNNNNNNSYIATRTSANGSATFMGMNTTAWTWLIIGIAAIAIVALVWYYSSQLTNHHSDNRRV